MTFQELANMLSQPSICLNQDQRNEIADLIAGRSTNEVAAFFGNLESPRQRANFHTVAGMVLDFDSFKQVVRFMVEDVIEAEVERRTKAAEERQVEAQREVYGLQQALHGKQNRIEHYELTIAQLHTTCEELRTEVTELENRAREDFKDAEKFRQMKALLAN